MRKHAIQRQKMPFGQIEDLVIHVHLDVAGKSLKGNSACRLVFMNKSIGLQHGQHNPEILLLTSVLEFRPPCQAFSSRNPFISAVRSKLSVALPSGPGDRIAPEMGWLLHCVGHAAASRCRFRFSVRPLFDFASRNSLKATALLCSVSCEL
jgi:hypothetical protein